MTVDKESRERFEREAQAAAALNHHNIVTVYEIGEFENHIFISMEYVEGKTLSEKMTGVVTNGHPPQPIEEIIDHATQICEGLEKAHQAGIFHRDIKPGNIIIDNDNRVKILDFGLAKLKGVSQLTKDATTIGTIHYMSTEQASGENIDHRTDIWSFGVVLYEMLTGQLPFQGEYNQVVVYAILNEEPASVRTIKDQIPRPLEAILKKALMKNPDERYQSMDAIRSDLEKIEIQHSLGKT